MESLRTALDQWLSESMGSEEERRVADAILSVVASTGAFLSSTSWCWQRKDCRDTFESLVHSVIALKGALDDSRN